METRPDRQHKANRSAAGGERQRANRALLVAVSALSGALLAVAAVALLLWFIGHGEAEPPVIGQAPLYRLIDQNGKKISSQDFAGKVRIVAALFPYCRELCPLVAANLAEFDTNVVQPSDLEGHVVFVFFNVAPAAAGPTEMRQFLKQYAWDPKDPAVEFLTGPPNEIERVVKRGFHIAYTRTPADADDDDSSLQVVNALADRVKPDFDIKHTGTVEVVDGRGRIRKIFTDGARVDDARLQSAIMPLVAP